MYMQSLSLACCICLACVAKALPGFVVLILKILTSILHSSATRDPVAQCPTSNQKVLGSNPSWVLSFFRIFNDLALTLVDRSSVSIN